MFFSNFSMDNPWIIHGKITISMGLPWSLAGGAADPAGGLPRAGPGPGPGSPPAGPAAPPAILYFFNGYPLIFAWMSMDNHYVGAWVKNKPALGRVPLHVLRQFYKEYWKYIPNIQEHTKIKMYKK